VALAARAGIRLRIGYAHAPGAPALTHGLAAEPREHAVRAGWRLACVTAAALGAGAVLADDCAPDSAPLRWVIAGEERVVARRWLAERGLGDGRAFLIAHPGAGAAIKQWGATQWARALSQIATARDLAIVLAGAPAERGQITMIAAALAGQQHPYVYISENGIGIYAALIASARLMLGVDSGPLHLAAAVGTPTVRLYGPSDPVVFGPWGPPERHIALAAELHCVPCGRLDYARAELPWHPCMALLPPAVVARAALRILDEITPGQVAFGADVVEQPHA
jgi:ADP-heptose:LPS heptosyltransferase